MTSHASETVSPIEKNKLIFIQTFKQNVLTLSEKTYEVSTIL